METQAKRADEESVKTPTETADAGLIRDDMPERTQNVLAETLPFPQSPESAQRYAVYSHEFSTPDGIAYTRSFIVLTNGHRVITRFTRLQDYAGIYRTGVFLPISANPEAKLHFICEMLNYILSERGDEFKVRHVFDITLEMLKAFFTYYALTPKADGTHRKQDTVERCVYAVTEFMANLSRKYGGYMRVDCNDLYREEAFRDRRGKRKVKRVPDFHIRGFTEASVPFRDIPTKAFEILLPMAFRYAPDIAFIMALQAFAGLRAGEALNVRREDSPLGPGIRFTEAGGAIVAAEIDLTKEYALRSDGKRVGNIKKARKQEVFHPFLEAFRVAYRYHMNFLEKTPFEREYAPLFPNSRGMAMTYSAYLKSFQRLVRTHFIPALLNSGDPELRIYGQALCENNLTPHSLRHWFTVQLVLRGATQGEIQFWRGDSNPQSSITYMRNKGDLIRRLREADSRLLEILMKTGEELDGG